LVDMEEPTFAETIAARIFAAECKKNYEAHMAELKRIQDENDAWTKRCGAIRTIRTTVVVKSRPGRGISSTTGQTPGEFQIDTRWCV